MVKYVKSHIMLRAQRGWTDLHSSSGVRAWRQSSRQEQEGRPQLQGIGLWNMISVTQQQELILPHSMCVNCTF